MRQRLWGEVILALVLGVLLAAAPAGPGLAAKPPVAPPADAKPEKPADLEQFDTSLGRKLYPLALSRGGAEVRLSGQAVRNLRAIFDDLARSARKMRRLNYSLHVLSSKDRIDAWVLPDGGVFVTLGLLRRLPTADEVGGVLAHQLAHAVLRHNLDDLTSPEDQALLAEVVKAKAAPPRERLGKAGVALLGEYYPVAEEQAADALARDFLRQNRFRESGLDNSFRRFAHSPPPAYLMAHPHPDARPLPPEPEQPPLIIIEVEQAPPPPKPMPWPAPPPAPAPTPALHPEPVVRAATPQSRSGLSLLAGYYPLSSEASSASVTVTDRWGATDSFQVQTAGATGGPAAGAILEVPFSPQWEGLLGAGWTGAGLFPGEWAHGGFVLAGVLRRGSVDGEGARWAAGPYLGLTWVAGRVGVTGAELHYGEDLIPKVVEAGTPVTATAVVPSVGALLLLSGDTPVAGVSWFAAVAGQVSTRGKWSYSSPASNVDETVNLPTAADSEQPAPLMASGVMALGGVVFRF